MGEISNASFGELLRTMRENQGLTQEELAERAGLSRDAISALERGRRSRPHPTTVKAIGAALGVSMEEAEHLRSAAMRKILPAVPTTPPGSHRLVPTALTSFIGRTVELTDLSAMVTDATMRLVTITGPGGVGKTRLALEVAGLTRSSYPGGTSFVPLGETLDSALVMPTIAERLGVRNPAGLALPEQIALMLGSAPFLLILDNMEQLPEAGLGIAELLAACANLTILTTSRTPLRIQGEWDFPVHPLHVGSATDPKDHDAVTLFVDRARAAAPGFQLTKTNAQAMNAICRRLDGLPLAIELAAARVKVLSPEALLARLEGSLDVLSGGPRNQDPRLQSIRSAIAWSFDLLDESEKRAFRALAIFVGRFTLRDAEVVLAAALHLHENDVLERIAGLIDDSLLRLTVDESGQPRYWMLFTLRSFALAELEASEDREAVHRAHALHVLGQTEAAADAFRNLPTAHQAEWFTVIETARGNWRAALSWVHEQGETGLLLRLTTSLAWFWYVRGPIAEGRFWLERALAMNPELADMRDRIPALMGGGMLAHYSGDGAAAREMLEACLVLEHEVPNNWWRASALWVLGMVERTAGNYTVAEAHLRAALVAYRALPHETNAVIILGQLGAAAWGSGDTERAQELCAEGIALQRQSGDRWGLGNTLGYSGLIALDLGDATTAARALQESLHIRAEETRTNRIDLLDTDTQPHWQAGAWYDVAGSLSNLAVLASFMGEHEAAAGLFGASGALRKLVGRTEPMLPARTVYVRAENTSRQHLGAARYAEVFVIGAAQSGPEALIDALTTADRLVVSTDSTGTHD